MSEITVTINGQEIRVVPGTTILEAAQSEGIYIPTLCHHPDLPPAKGAAAAGAIYQGQRRVENAIPGETGKECGICVVEVEGKADLVSACTTPVKDAMVVFTENDRVRQKRQENLMPILARHPHACLTCAQQAGCSRTQCSSNVPENERCCPLFGHCELQRVANYIGIAAATPKWIPMDLPRIEEDPLFFRDYNLCIGCTRCVRVCRDLRGIEAIGFVYDGGGRVQVGTLALSLQESGCMFCTACVEVCPTGALLDKRVRPGRKEAGYLEAARKEARRFLQSDSPLRLRRNPHPPERLLTLNEESIHRVPETEGVYRLYDQERRVIAIQGTAELRKSLIQALEANPNARWFDFEEDKMYSQRESEMIQQHLQAHGEMPRGGESDLDDLY
jgi:formate hydrogenlyase subunit 6/NADH:ubiquinone oxidoreductase subunit I